MTRTLRASLKLFLLGLTTLATTAAVTVYADDPPTEWKAPSRAAKRKNPIASGDASIAAGKAVYLKQCLSCHGAGGKGDGPAAKDLPKPPHDLTDPAIVAQSDGTLQWKIATGKKPMPAFEKLISEDETWQAVIYLRTLAPPTPTK